MTDRRFASFALDLRSLDHVRRHAARHGWLIETPDEFRAGWGRTLAADQVSLDANGSWEAVDPPLLGHLADVEVDAGPLAFSFQPFERRSALHAWLPEHSLYATRDGQRLWTASGSIEAALADMDATEDDPSAPYSVQSRIDELTEDAYESAVRRLVTVLREGSVEKVVLGQGVRVRVDRAIDPAVIADRLRRREPSYTLYALGWRGGRFVGATPELLVGVTDGSVRAHPLAGTVSLDRPSAVDADAALLGSEKMLREHASVVEDLRERLEPACRGIAIDSRPSVVRYRTVSHLGTWVRAKTRHSSISATNLLALLHPTPAVGGRPRERAATLIAELEPRPRDCFAGSVGWLDAQGNGEFWIAIRGLELRDRAARLWGGAGIVADSDPADERLEVAEKVARLLAVLDPIV